MAKQSIARNYILNTIYQVLNLIVPLITMPYIARVLGAEKLGIYSFSNAVVMFFALFAVLGTSTYGQQVIAQIRDDKQLRSKTFWEVECLSLITTLFSTLAWLIVVWFQVEYRIYFLILTIELMAVALDIAWFYSGLERFVYIVVPNIIIKLASTITLFVFVNTDSDLWKYILILVVSKLIGNASMWICLPHLLEPIEFKELNIKSHLKETMIYFIPTIAASVYSYLDKVMIQWFTETDVENGYYDQANRIIHIAYTMIVSINTVMASRMAYLFAQKKNVEIKEKLENATAFIFSIGFPCSFGICAIAADFVPWFWGDGFDKVIILLYIASPLVVILSLHNLLAAQYLVPSGQRVRSTKGVFVGAAVNFGCNLILIPQLHSIGAVIGTIIAEMVICIVYLWMSKEYVPITMLIKYIPKQMFASVLMCFVIIQVGKIININGLVTVIQIMCGIIVYILILLILRERFVIRMYKLGIEKIRNKLKR